MKSPAVRSGVYALVFTLIWTLLEHVLGYNTTKHDVGQYTRMIGGFVFYVFVFIAVYKTRAQQGSLSFGQGIKAGSVTSLIYSIGVVAIYSIYGEVINKQFKPTLLAFERSQLVASGAPADVIDAKIKILDLQTGGSVMSYVFLFVFMFLGGVVCSVIASLIFQRKAKVTA